MKKTFTVVWYDDNDQRQETQYFAESAAEASDAFYFEYQMGEGEDGSDKEIDYQIIEEVD